MTAFPFAIVGFDLDGTLLDTSGDLTAAVNHTLALAGRPPLSREEVISHIGGGTKLMLQQGLAQSGGVDTDAFKGLYRELLRYYETNIAVHTRPYPGMIDMLDALDERGVIYAIVTNKFEGLARKLLSELGFLERFCTVLGADTLGVANAKPSPAPIHEMIARCGGGRAVFIGDSAFDIEAARAAGVTSVAVSFGFLHGPVEMLNADHNIDNFSELVPLLAGL